MNSHSYTLLEIKIISNFLEGNLMYKSRQSNSPLGIYSLEITIEKNKDFFIKRCSLQFCFTGKMETSMSNNRNLVKYMMSCS